MAKKRITVECACNEYTDLKAPCCEFFKQMLNDCGVRLGYSTERNVYGIRIVGSDSFQRIKYCPWCGTYIYPSTLED